MTHKNFPTFAVIVLIFSLAWLLTELGFMRINIPWLPIIFMIIAMGWIVNRYS